MSVFERRTQAKCQYASNGDERPIRAYGQSAEMTERTVHIEVGNVFLTLRGRNVRLLANALKSLAEWIESPEQPPFEGYEGMIDVEFTPADQPHSTTEESCSRQPSDQELQTYPRSLPPN